MIGNANWGMITDIILGASILWIGVLAFVGFCQLIKRKSLLKVDRWLVWMGVIMVVMGALYLFFNKVLILNYSPADPTKPSFPSSHVMASWTVFLTTMVAMKKFVKNKVLRVIMVILMVILMSVVACGRVWSGNHWISDVIAGMIFAIILSFIYKLLIREKKDDKCIHEDNQ